MVNDKMKKGSKTVDPIKSKREIQAVIETCILNKRR